MTHGDSLCLIFFLLRLQGELDEELLQLLIAVVDAELLKAVHRSRTKRGNGSEHRKVDSWYFSWK